MKYFAIAGCLLAAMQGVNAQAETGFSWFHTRPKPVLLDEQSTKTAVAAKTPKRLAYQRAEPDSSSSQVYVPPSKSRMTDVVRGRRTGARPANSESKPELKK
jgi:hypothetical protein